jgi:hypothetical protein
VYPNVNEKFGRSGWDYDGLMVSWGVQDSYEVVRKVGRGKVSSCVLWGWIEIQRSGKGYRRARKGYRTGDEPGMASSRRGRSLDAVDLAADATQVFAAGLPPAVNMRPSAASHLSYSAAHLASAQTTATRVVSPKLDVCRRAACRLQLFSRDGVQCCALGSPRPCSVPG